MLTIHIEGAQNLLTFLTRISSGNPPANAELQVVRDSNQFFIDFYSCWKGVTRERLIETMRRFHQPDYQPESPVLSALAKGFARAVVENKRMQANLDFLRGANPSIIVEGVLAHLPAHTPLQSAIHITIDGFNGGFQYQGQMGWSLLNDITSPAQFESGIAHELHHVGFAYWIERNLIRKSLLNEKSGKSVAARHVQNLLSEGLAMYYCSPNMMMEDRVPEAYARKLASYHRDERLLFTQSEKLLALTLKPDADYATCNQALQALSIDFDGILPIGHYLGARMIETMSQHHPQERIVECVQSLVRFLPLYNQAARKSGEFVYDSTIVEQVNQIFHAEQIRHS
jgi:hypothetical protein